MLPLLITNLLEIILTQRRSAHWASYCSLCCWFMFCPNF